MVWSKSDPQKSHKTKVIRMKPPISENDRMLRAILLELPRASQVPYKEKNKKNTFYFDYVPYFPYPGALGFVTYFLKWYPRGPGGV